MILALVTGLGLSLTLGQILAPLRRVRVLVATVVANSVLAPLVGIGVCHALPLSSESRVGVELAVMAAAGPVGMKAAQLTKRADMAMALSFTIALQVVNIVAAPLWAKAGVARNAKASRIAQTGFCDTKASSKLLRAIPEPELRSRRVEAPVSPPSCVGNLPA